MTLVAVCGNAAQAQASNPAALRQYLDQINANAAAQTWGYKTGVQPGPLDPSVVNQVNASAAVETFGNIASATSSVPTGSQQTSNNSNSGSSAGPSNSGFPGSGALGFAAIPSDGGASGPTDSGAPAGSSTAPSQDSATVPTQSPAQDAATSSTSSTPGDSLAAPATPAPEPAPTTKPRPATVTYQAGLLTVRADDSSLNLILRRVARLTGVTISGGVADVRVFGNYGPARPSAVLSTLLDGTGSDVVLRKGPDATITELILTPRGGGAVPPGPNASVWGPDDDQSNGK
jgi:hypothetical protein